MNREYSYSIVHIHVDDGAIILLHRGRTVKPGFSPNIDNKMTKPMRGKSEVASQHTGK